MYLLKRIQLSIFRQRLKTMVLLLLVSIIGTFIAGSIIMEQTFNTTVTRLQQSIPPVTSAVLIETESIGPNQQILTRDAINYIGGFPEVSHFDYSIIYHIFGKYEWYDMFGQDESMALDSNWFRLFGVSRPEIIYIENGMYELYAGRSFTEEEVNPSTPLSISPIMISRQFAELNNLWLGSKVSLYHETFISPDPLPEERIKIYQFDELWNHPYMVLGEQYYEFEVVGIFNFNRDIQESVIDRQDHETMINLFFAPNWRVYEVTNGEWEAGLLQNEVFDLSPVWQAHNFTPVFERSQHFDAFWVLSAIEGFEEFRERANAVLINYGMEVSDLSSTFGSMLTTTNHLNSLVSQFFWIASGGMIIILTLIILFYVSERKHEIGIYLALGEKRWKIVLILLSEILIITALGFLIAFITGYYFSESISQTLIQNELISNASDEFDIPPFLERIGFAQEMTIEEMMAAFEVSLSSLAIVRFVAIGFGLTILSSLIPILYIFEQDPRKILM